MTPDTPPDFHADPPAGEAELSREALIAANEALRRSEARLSAIFAGAEAGLSEISTDGYFRRVNATLSRILGRSEADLLRLGVADVTAPEDLAQTVEALQSLKASGRPVSIDKRYVRPDGTRVWANSTISLLEGGPLQEPMVLAVTIDLTDRKRTEAALRESREHLERVMESVRDYAIITIDAGGTIIGWNTGAVATFGFSEEDAVGRSAAVIFTPEDRANRIPEKEMETARKTGHANDERWHIRKNGERFWVSGVMSPLFDNDILTGYVKVARDLTEHRLAEAAVRDSEARFRTLADAVPQVVWTNLPEGGVNYLNWRWFDYTGLTLEESMGWGWQTVIHPDDAAQSVERWKRSLATGEIFETEYRLRGSDGEYRWFIGRNIPVRGYDGKVIAWFGTATDVENMKRAEEALRQSEEGLRLAHDKLESRVKERTRELSEALDRLREEIDGRAEVEEARRELLRRLVTSQEEERRRISRELHDNLGQHMVAVKLGLDRLESESGAAAGKGFEQLRELVDMLIKAAHRQAWELRPAELDHLGLETALEHYLNDWSARTGISAVFISRDPVRFSPEIEIAFYRIVQESLTNVARHAEASEVRVTLDADPAPRITIEDDGRGFDPKIMTGRLGVLGMKERLFSVGGSLEIESAPGRGTKLTAKVDGAVD